MIIMVKHFFKKRNSSENRRVSDYSTYYEESEIDNYLMESFLIIYLFKLVVIQDSEIEILDERCLNQIDDSVITIVEKRCFCCLLLNLDIKKKWACRS